jgi:hypothetical protein
MTRAKFATRTIYLRAEQQRETIISLARQLPLDDENPLQVTISEEVKVRKLDQNGLMWVGPLKDISEQGWLEGRQYSDKSWHELFKREYLPEVCDENADQYKKGYRKWDIDVMTGEPVLVGNTTELTVKGFAMYLVQVYAFGAQIGVNFHANPNAMRRAA